MTSPYKNIFLNFLSRLSSTWSQMKKNKFLLKLLKLAEFQSTSTWSRRSVKITSTWDVVSTHGTLSESIRCFPVPEQIVSKLVWEVLGVSQTERLLVSRSALFFSQSELRKPASETQWKPSEEVRTSSQEDKRSSFLPDGDSLNTLNTNT